MHSPGGMQAIAWDLLSEFAKLGHRVTVVTTRLLNVHGSVRIDGVDVVALPTSAERYSAEWWRESRKYVYSIRDQMDAFISISVAGASVAELKYLTPHVPFLCQLHGTSWGEAVSKWKSMRLVEFAKSIKNLWWAFKDAQIYKRFDQLVLVGDGLRSQFDRVPTRWLAASARKTVISNGVDTAMFRFDLEARKNVRRQFGWTEDVLVLVFCARLHAQKGGAEAIRALVELQRSGVRAHLLLVGDGPERENLVALGEKAGCTKTLIFAGSQPRRNIPHLLSAADLFLFPTQRVEGLPMNVLEALSTGLSCVCADGLREVFGEELSIHYAQPADARDLSNKIRLACEQPRGARHSLLPAKFSLATCASSYLDLINKFKSTAAGV